MIIEQLYDKGLAHGSYVIISQGKAAIIDPARDPQPYFDFVKLHNAQIVAVVETHPHADFVSSHLEIAQKTDSKNNSINQLEFENNQSSFLDKERDYEQKFNHKINNKKLFNSVESPIPNTANFNSMAS